MDKLTVLTLFDVWHLCDISSQGFTSIDSAKNTWKYSLYHTAESIYFPIDDITIVSHDYALILQVL